MKSPFSVCPQEDINLVNLALKNVFILNRKKLCVKYEFYYEPSSKTYTLNGRDNLGRILYTGMFSNIRSLFDYVRGMVHVLEDQNVKCADDTEWNDTNLTYYNPQEVK